MEQPDGTFIAWAGEGEAIDVDYIEDGPEFAKTAALFALQSEERSRSVFALTDNCERGAGRKEVEAECARSPL